MRTQFAIACLALGIGAGCGGSAASTAKQCSTDSPCATGEGCRNGVCVGDTTTFSISGQVSMNGAGAPGVTVSLGGAVTRTTTTDVGGNYAFNALQSGVYTVTASKSGCVFSASGTSKATATVPVNGGNASQNFEGSAASAYSISGTVSGAVAAGVTISLGAAGSTATDASGNYALGGLANGTYVMTPSKTGFSFSPATRTVIVSGADVTGQNFTAAAAASLWDAMAWDTAVWN